MRFNFDAGPIGKQLIEVLILGHLAEITIWEGLPFESRQSQYLLQFLDGAWPDGMPAEEKCKDAARAAISHWDTNERPWDANVQLGIVDATVRWPGRLIEVS